MIETETIVTVPAHDPILLPRSSTASHPHIRRSPSGRRSTAYFPPMDQSTVKTGFLGRRRPLVVRLSGVFGGFTSKEPYKKTKGSGSQGSDPSPGYQTGMEVIPKNDGQT